MTGIKDNQLFDNARAEVDLGIDKLNLEVESLRVEKRKLSLVERINALKVGTPQLRLERARLERNLKSAELDQENILVKIAQIDVALYELREPLVAEARSRRLEDLLGISLGDDGSLFEFTVFPPAGVFFGPKDDSKPRGFQLRREDVVGTRDPRS